MRGRILSILAAAGLAILLAALPGSAAATPADGTIDTSFGSGGFSTVSLGTSFGAAAVVVQPDGGIVTAGQAVINGEDVIAATRMTPSGALDPSFGQGGIVIVHINGGAGVDSGAGLALQQDGKIVIAGSGRNGTYGPLTFAAVRLNPNGTLDQTFGAGGITNVPIGSYSIANAVVIQPDGKIDLAGTALETHNEFAAARLNPNGTLDTGFGNGGIITVPSVTGGAWGLGLQQDGKLVLGGQADYANPQVANAQQFMAVRLTANGLPDSTFGSGGIVTLPVGGTALGYGVAVQSDGKLLLAGPAFTTTGVNAVVRLLPSGALDTTYGSGGIATVPDWYGANGIVLDGFGRPVLPAVGASAVRVTTSGAADAGFGSGGSTLAPLGTNDAANGAAIQPDGKIVLAGAATVNGQVVLEVVRINATAPATTTTTTTTTSTPSTTSTTTSTTTTTTSSPTTTTTTTTTPTSTTKTTTTTTTTKTTTSSSHKTKPGGRTATIASARHPTSKRAHRKAAAGRRCASAPATRATHRWVRAGRHHRKLRLDRVLSRRLTGCR